jgi:hypothetical protein
MLARFSDKLPTLRWRVCARGRARGHSRAAANPRLAANNRGWHRARAAGCRVFARASIDRTCRTAILASFNPRIDPFTPHGRASPIRSKKLLFQQSDMRLLSGTLVLALFSAGCDGSEGPPRALHAGDTGGTSGAGTGGTGGTAGSGATGGSAGDAGTRPVPSPEVAAFAGQMAKAICAELTSCCAASGFSLTEADCQDVLGVALSETFAINERTGGKVHPEAIDDCLAKLKLEGQDCAQENPDSVDAVSACVRAFHGDNPRGAACTTNLDCALAEGAGASCVTSGSSLDGGVYDQGICHEERMAREGEACSLTFDEQVNYVCDRTAGFYCDVPLTSQDGTCKRYRSPGESCVDAQCAPTSSFCNGTTCEALRGPGSSCDAAFQCRLTTYCDAASATCVAMGQPGDACRDGLECASNACLRGRCAPTSIWATMFGDTYCR